ncbi:hypothetical protein Lalb_Chr03g0037261 [Lupinus albus]|uniref:Uncharacterized protein n=1 Tax=Lupinus albus TaxID=3870 RepID=A0A6A4QVP0_LUPAL|nr:hypothetical protein Lalb_Chr03g0037261 [Lupinus albus]
MFIKLLRVSTCPILKLVILIKDITMYSDPINLGLCRSGQPILRGLILPLY